MKIIILNLDRTSQRKSNRIPVEGIRIRGPLSYTLRYPIKLLNKNFNIYA